MAAISGHAYRSAFSSPFERMSLWSVLFEELPNPIKQFGYIQKPIPHYTSPPTQMHRQAPFTGIRFRLGGDKT